MLHKKKYHNQIVQILDSLDDDQLDLTMRSLESEHLSRLLWYVEGEMMNRYRKFTKSGKNNRSS